MEIFNLCKIALLFKLNGTLLKLGQFIASLLCM